MKFSDILTQWNSLIDYVQALQNYINDACLDKDAYQSEQELQDLKNMRRGCYELFSILLGYFD